MRKTFKAALVAAGILLLAGCGKQVANNNQSASSAGNSAQAQKQEQKGNGMISSIADAMGLGKTMRCTYRVKAGNENMEMAAYVKGEKYAMEMNMKGETQKTVFDGEAMYTWSKEKKQGTKMTKKCMEELGQGAPENTDEGEEMSFSAQDKNFKNAVDVKCEEVSNADFSIPGDVTFTDQCEEMKRMMESVKNMNMNQGGAQAGMPENMPKNMPSAPELVP